MFLIGINVGAFFIFKKSSYWGEFSQKIAMIFASLIVEDIISKFSKSLRSKRMWHRYFKPLLWCIALALGLGATSVGFIVSEHPEDFHPKTFPQVWASLIQEVGMLFIENSTKWPAEVAREKTGGFDNVLSRWIGNLKNSTLIWKHWPSITRPRRNSDDIEKQGSEPRPSSASGDHSRNDHGQTDDSALEENPIVIIPGSRDNANGDGLRRRPRGTGQESGFPSTSQFDNYDELCKLVYETVIQKENLEDDELSRKLDFLYTKFEECKRPERWYGRYLVTVKAASDRIGQYLGQPGIEARKEKSLVDAAHALERIQNKIFRWARS